MIDKDTIAEIVATYQKHGWILRRVLSSVELRKYLGEQTDALFGDVAIFDSKIDAAWFSRPPKKGGVAWEIRYLSNIPLAMLEKADEGDPAFEDILQSVETRLSETIAAKEGA